MILLYSNSIYVIFYAINASSDVTIPLEELNKRDARNDHDKKNQQDHRQALFDEPAHRFAKGLEECGFQEEPCAARCDAGSDARQQRTVCRTRLRLSVRCAITGHGATGG